MSIRLLVAPFARDARGVLSTSVQVGGSRSASRPRVERVRERVHAYGAVFRCERQAAEPWGRVPCRG